ncbi:MAG TPA: putative ABC transporter permease [Sphaerochaeta sp.]|nr:putative ABC transporter permease [Sphaerochaeta sp.]
MQFDQYFLYFSMYAIIGYISEVIYCSIPLKRLVNRGFLHGPYLPIYGFGALLVVVPLMFFNTHPILVFLIAVLLTSSLEYVTSFLLEKIFHTKLWDYSKNFGNINGRVCLLNSTLFGMMGLVATYWLHPALVRLVSGIPSVVLSPLSRVLLLAISIDATSSVYRMAAFQKQLSEFRVRVKELEERIELLTIQSTTPTLASLKLRLNNELDELRLRLNKRSKWIFNAFPSITARNEEQRLQLELLKMNFRSYREKKKEQRGK